MKIRPATTKDIPDIYQFICDLAEYEKALEQVKCRVDTLRESLFGDDVNAYGLMLEDQGKAVGYAIYFFNYSTWEAAKGLYLEDLYVDPAYRGKGGGLALTKHLAGIAQKKRCVRFEWSVLDWNTPSIRFYDSLGAKPQNEWIGYRLEGQALNKLASSGASICLNIVGQKREHAAFNR